MTELDGCLLVAALGLFMLLLPVFVGILREPRGD